VLRCVPLDSKLVRGGHDKPAVSQGHGPHWFQPRADSRVGELPTRLSQQARPGVFRGQVHPLRGTRWGSKKGARCYAANVEKSTLTHIRALARFAGSLEVTDAANLSAAEQAAHSQAWLPGAHEDALGTGRAQPATQEGAASAYCEAPVQARSCLTSEGLPRHRRLTRSSEVRAIVATGARRRSHRLEIIWCPNELGHSRLGVVVPRFGYSAVARNLLRRRLREHVRRYVLPTLPPLDLVIRARPAAYATGAAELRSDLERWCLQLRT
jgi:ribonuclease P protein component